MGRRITQLPITTTLGNNDDFVLVQDGVTRRIKGSNFKSAVADGLPVKRAVNTGFDGGTVNGVPQSIQQGQFIEIRTPYTIQVTRWSLLPQGVITGSILIDIQVKPFDSGTFQSITNGTPVQSTNGARTEGVTTTWQSIIPEGSIIRFEVTSVTGNVPRVTILLEGFQQ